MKNPKPFASSENEPLDDVPLDVDPLDVPDWDTVQVPEERVKPEFQTWQVDPLEEEHVRQLATPQFNTVSFMSFCTGPPEPEDSEFM